MASSSAAASQVPRHYDYDHDHESRYADTIMKKDRWESGHDANWAYHSHAHYAHEAYGNGHIPVPLGPAPTPPTMQLTNGYAYPHAQPQPQPQQHHAPRVPKTNTSPIATRTSVARHGSGSHSGVAPRPKSSGGERMAALPYRSFAPPKRAESYSQPTPLEEFRRTRRWPPAGYREDDNLSAADAEDLICAGASTFKGYGDAIEHAPSGYMRYYAVMDSEHQGRTDRAPFRHPAYRDISLDTTGAGASESMFPWLALEQPCMASAFGKSPGTTTLNYWVGKSGSGNPPTKFVGSTRPRKMKLLHILDRLQRLESGLDEDAEEQYRYLYRVLIEPPDDVDFRDEEARFGLEQQIADLIAVLTHPSWIDFSNPKNQVVAKFFDSPDQHKKQDFFHQLLLSAELHLRIHSRHHSDKAKRKLILQLPPTIAWDLAVAQRWLENMSITKSRTSSSQSTFSFELTSKERQKEALRVFASTLKWPNMDELEYVLDEKDASEVPLEDRSADAMTWFSGIILPGTTLPWLVMNSLIDCDRDTGDALKYLTHMHPAAGFQYRANTYWSSSSIVGKVLGAARGVKQVAGWIGPCIYSPDLKRTECVRVHQLPSLDPKLLLKDVDTLDIRSHPLGPPDAKYPIQDYEVPMCDTEDVTDDIRMEKLSLVPAKEQPAARSVAGAKAPLVFDAAIVFACRSSRGGAESWALRLKWDVEFVNAFPCHQGPHVLFYDFQYKCVKIDSGLVDISDWGKECGRLSQPPPHPSSSASPSTVLATQVLAHTQVQKVLAIEALGVSDNEVFARAWCAHHGFSAIVANIKETCMSCAIREAYAACVSVVILTEGGRNGEGDRGVWDGDGESD